MKDLDISKIPARFVYFWWLKRIVKYFDALIISEEQVYIFSAGNQIWDMYRDHMIYIRDEIGTMTVKEYKRGKLEAVDCMGEAGSKTLRLV